MPTSPPVVTSRMVFGISRPTASFTASKVCSMVPAVSLAMEVAPKGVRVVAVAVGGGKSVLVPMDWIDAHSNIVTAVGGDKSAAMKSTAANGRKVWECYVLGLAPEKTDDFKITSFPMKSDGTPDLSAITFEPEQNQWNLSGAVPKLKGKATLDAEWQDVPPGGNPSFRFFTVEVQMP